MTELQIVALVSIGAHPSSGRPRRAEQDARAVELGLRLVEMPQEHDSLTAALHELMS